MATVKIKLDTRRAKSNDTYNIIYKIRHLKKVHTINAGISVLKKHWNSTNSRVINSCPNAKSINLKLLNDYLALEKAILALDDEVTIEKLRLLIKGKTETQTSSFKTFTQQLIDEMLTTKNTGNALVYRTAMNRFLDFCKKDITFTEIDYVLLQKFENHLKLKGLKQNSISNYFRTIRAIYNKAIKHKLVDRSHYPFYDITIKSEQTAKRAISREDIKRLQSIELDEDSTASKSLKYFMLSFYLRGISFTDMAYLKASNINNGRILYNRRKTHKNYSIRLFKPAEAIIKSLQYENSSYLLPIINETLQEDSLEAKKVIKQWIKTTNKYLKRLSLELQSDSTITTYTARHSFATIAKRLGYSNELIAEALGHEYGNKTTAIYLDAFDTNKIDELHIAVIS
ncbi:site-specific integrase [Winogradskyella ouciana]|uniref:Tyrosine-type recombinase/integrase n=1 Tax=Winogradskyella ouciana TaxID=2608631 RepID=A0A7K1GAT8_9FLAO|nr:site-specific integrase [Winogradskyella ouciana]MTE25498.1 tyrosine-type recombinase/integrase [Winogradskyella ouciana]